jgi:hypothetical protein
MHTEDLQLMEVFFVHEVVNPMVRCGGFQVAEQGSYFAWKIEAIS